MFPNLSLGPADGFDGQRDSMKTSSLQKSQLWKHVEKPLEPFKTFRQLAIENSYKLVELEILSNREPFNQHRRRRCGSLAFSRLALLNIVRAETGTALHAPVRRVPCALPPAEASQGLFIVNHTD